MKNYTIDQLSDIATWEDAELFQFMRGVARDAKWCADWAERTHFADFCEQAHKVLLKKLAKLADAKPETDRRDAELAKKRVDGAKFVQCLTLPGWSFTVAGNSIVAQGPYNESMRVICRAVYGEWDRAKSQWVIDLSHGKTLATKIKNMIKKQVAAPVQAVAPAMPAPVQPDPIQVVEQVQAPTTARKMIVAYPASAGQLTPWGTVVRVGGQRRINADDDMVGREGQMGYVVWVGM